jgi:hypothetical protein
VDDLSRDRIGRLDAEMDEQKTYQLIDNLRFKTVIKIYTEVVKCYEILHAGCNLRI